MKIRSDFVTNSSSSSYVIAYRTPSAIDDEALKKFPILRFYNKFVKGIIEAEDCCGDTCKGVLFEDQEKYDEYFVEEYGWRGEKTVQEVLDKHDDDYLRRSYEEISDYFQKGYGIIAKDVGYSDDGLRNMIHVLADDNDDFIIIDDE